MAERAETLYVVCYRIVVTIARCGDVDVVTPKLAGRFGDVIMQENS